MNRSAAGKIGALVRLSREDPTEMTAKARAGAASKYVTDVLLRAAEKGEVLSELEIARRAKAAQQAHLTRIAQISADKRRGRPRA